MKAPLSEKARRMLNAGVDLAEAIRTGEPFEFEGKTYIVREAPSYGPTRETRKKALRNAAESVGNAGTGRAPKTVSEQDGGHISYRMEDPCATHYPNGDYTFDVAKDHQMRREAMEEGGEKLSNYMTLMKARVEDRIAEESEEEPQLPPLQYKKEHEEKTYPRPPQDRVVREGTVPECSECHSSLYRERVVSWLPWPTRKTDRCINPGCPNAHPEA